MKLNLHYVLVEEEKGDYFMCDLRSSQNIRVLQMQPDQDVIFYSKILNYSESGRDRLDFLMGLKEEEFSRIHEYSENGLYSLCKKVVLLTEREISLMKTLKLSLDYKVSKIMKEFLLLQKFQKDYLTLNSNTFLD